MSEPNDLVREFLIESHENLDQLDLDLIALEGDPQDRVRLANIFRTIHTIKGTCGFFGFGKLEAVTHAGEHLLSLLRDGDLLLDPKITTALLRLVDAVREMLAQIEARGMEGDGNYQDLIDHLTHLQASQSETLSHVPAAPAHDAEAPLTALPKKEEHRSEPAAPTGDSPLHASLSESNIRVDVGLLNKLMTLVGELVLARNQLLQFSGKKNDPVFMNTAQRLNRITSELQEGVMKTRMQPIGTIWDRFPRVVRDLALSCGKKVRVEMEGRDTELDKSIIEAIKDPLTHIVRNSVDHGIERPEVRVERGKPAEGCLALRACHEGGQVIIEISDDGGGIDPERLKKKALERGLISFEQAAQMSDMELLGLIFLPGFSTAEKITNVSGRGVGMDVVKTNIEKINGTLDLQSKPGQGTMLRIKIPLTLAIIPALIVVSGGERYAIPQVSLVELMRLEHAHGKHGIEHVHGAPVFRMRGNLLPLVNLNEVLGHDRAQENPAPTSRNLVVLQAEQRQFGLLVDLINDTEEIVVKPLSQQLKGIPIYAGATIMGDGRVALILDVLGLARHAGLIADGHEHKRSDDPVAQGSGAEQHTFLMVQAGKRRRLAIPLAQVARLEEIAARDIERADEQQVLRYRGHILTLIHVGTCLFGEMPAQPSEHLPLVVCVDNDRAVGLLVERIVDIVTTPLHEHRAGRRSGLLGSAVINNQVTDLMDLAGLMESMNV